MKKTTAFCQRTKMIGGGTSYTVRFLTKDKPSHPLHGFTYATTICDNGREFFEVRDAIDPRPRWSMPQGWDKYEAGKKLDKKGGTSGRADCQAGIPRIARCAKAAVALGAVDTRKRRGPCFYQSHPPRIA